MDSLSKKMHENEFRLRILVTDNCNKVPRCHDCLNDFQDIPQFEHGSYVDVNLATSLMNEYNNFMTFKNITKRTVTFSGGEPGLHPELETMLSCADSTGILVTNGLALYKIDFAKFFRKNTMKEIHIGFKNHLSLAFADKLEIFLEKNIPIVFQTYTYDNFELSVIKNTIKIFIENCGIASEKIQKLIKFKIFLDKFNSSFYDYYETYIKNMQTSMKPFVIEGRYTGIQSNRGPGCSNCLKTCVTLKALWLFPDNTVSPCPQNKELRVQPNKSCVEDAFNFHNKTF